MPGDRETLVAMQKALRKIANDRPRGAWEGGWLRFSRVRKIARDALKALTAQQPEGERDGR